jgi:hypothetical protein
MTTIRPCRVCGTKVKPARARNCAKHTRPRSPAQQAVLAFMHAEGKHKQGRPAQPLTRHAKRYQDRLAAGLCVDCGDPDRMPNHRLCFECYEKRQPKHVELDTRDLGLTCPVRTYPQRAPFVINGLEHVVVWDGAAAR